MPRTPRLNVPEGWYHVSSRGIDRRRIFLDERDRTHFLEVLQMLPERFRIGVYAYVLMENHYHLLVQTPEANLSAALQWLNVSYSVWFNLRHSRVGPLFQGRFKAVVVEPEVWGLPLSRYLHLNPVRTKEFGLDKGARRNSRVGVGDVPSEEMIRRRIQRLRSYRWSSYLYYIGRAKAPAWLTVEPVLRRTAGPPRERRSTYQRDCERALGQAEMDEPWSRVVGRLVLGSKEFLKELRRTPLAEEPSSKLQPRPSWAQIAAAVEQVVGKPWKEFAERRGDFGRDLALYLGRRLGGLTLRTMGEATNMNVMAVSLAVKRLGQRLENDKNLRKAKAAVEALLFNV